MDSAVVTRQVNEKFNEQAKEEQENKEKGRLINSLPGAIASVRDRLIAIIPAVLIGIILSGLKAIAISLSAWAGCFFVYAIYQKVKHEKLEWNYNLIYYFVLFIAIIPNTTNWWMALLGGLLISGYWLNFKDKAPFNIALAIWLIIASISGADQLFGSQMQPEQMPYFKMYIANTGAGLGEYFLPAVIFGGTYLLYKRIINWNLVLSFIGTVLILAAIGGDNPLMHFLSGSLVLGVMFLTPNLEGFSRRFSLFYGFLGGTIAIFLRFFGGFLTAIPITILIMDWIVIIKLLREQGKSVIEEIEVKETKENIVQQTKYMKKIKESRILGLAIIILTFLALITSIFITTANPLTQLFMSLGLLEKFFIIILYYFTIQKLSNHKRINYNTLQIIISTLVVVAIII